MGKKEKSTFASWQHSRNRKISCTATFVLPLSDTFASGIAEERLKLKLNHLRSMHWTTSNPSIPYYTKQWRQDWLAFQGTVLWKKRAEFSGRSLKIWILLSASNVCIVKYFPTNKSHYCFRLDSNSNINNSLAKLSWTSCSPPLNSSHEHPSEQEEQLNDMKDRRTCFPDGKSL